MSTAAAERKLEQFRDEPLRPGDPRHRVKGRLVIIGGHEDKKDERTILRCLVDRIGDGKLVVATLATAEPEESFAEYDRTFRALGVHHVHHLRIADRAEANSLRPLQVLEDATAVFFTGGDQLKITGLVGDTPTYSRIFEILLEGGTLAGTSAGASVMSETMLIGGGQGRSHRIDDNLKLGPGFGFAKDMVIDQHFAERGRVSRLLGVVAQNPRVIGIGIDENTAIDLRPNRDFQVIGEGGVTVLDGRTITYSNLTDARTDETLSLFGVTTHLLSQGDVFDLETRTPHENSADVIDDGLETSDVDEEAAADD